MQAIMTGFVFVLAETGVVLLVVIAYMAWRTVKRHRSRRQHVEHFMQTYNSHKGENTSSAISKLQNGCNMNPEDAEQAVTRINASERKIYRRILNLILGNEANNTFDIQKEMEGLSEGWLDTMKVALKNANGGGEGKMEMAHMRRQLEFLKKENSRISENYLHMRARLETAVELLGNLVKEYSMLYSDGGESNKIVEAIEEELNDIKHAMQEADKKVAQLETDKIAVAEESGASN